MKTTSKIIDELGGSTVVAALLKIPATTTVASWKDRGVIPVQHWQALINFAKAKGVDGVTIESLAKIAAAKPVATKRRTAPGKSRERARASA